MTRLLKRMFVKRVPKERVRDRRPEVKHLPMMLSFDGRVVRLRLPDDGDLARMH